MLEDFRTIMPSDAGVPSTQCSFSLSSCRAKQMRFMFRYALVVPAFLMYFFLISYFAWLNMVMANVWKLTV